MTHFVVVRHGETQWNVEQRMQGHFDSPLTAAGRAQAAAIAARLAADPPFELVVSSDLGRALDTARAVAAATGHEVRTDRRLRERNWGVGEGLSYAEIGNRYPDAFRPDHQVDPDYAVPGGESRRAFHARVVEAFEDLAAQLPEGRIVVVTHGGALSAIYRHVHRIPHGEPPWSRNELQSQRIAIANASYNALSFDAGAWAIHAWADVDHLADSPRFEET